MKLRPHTLWRVPVYCIAAGIVTYFLTIFLGRWFFVVSSTGTDGMLHVSLDPIRSSIFQWILFLALLLLGGLWASRSMTRWEIALSAAIAAALYLAVTLAELCLPAFPGSLSLLLAPLTSWTAALSSLLLRLTDHLFLSVLLPDFLPFLFILFGKGSVAPVQAPVAG